MARHGGARTTLLVLRELSVNDTHAHRDISLRVVLLSLVLELLLQAKAAITDEDVVHLLEVEIDVVVVVRVLPPVPLALSLLLAADGRTLHVLSVGTGTKSILSLLLNAVVSLPRLAG